MFWKHDKRWLNSIAFRMAASVFVVIASILIVLSISLYNLLSWRLKEEDNRFMDDAVSLIQSTLASRDNVSDLLHEQIPRQLGAFHFHHYLVRIIPQQIEQHPVFQSAHFPKALIPALDHLPIKSNDSPKQDGQVVQLSSGQSYLLLTVPGKVGHTAPLPVVIQIALNITSKVRVLNQLQIYMLFLALGGSAVAGISGAWLVKRSLRPLHQMGDRIQQIRMDSLEKRVDNQQWPTELQPLAKAFDRLLVRLQKDVDQITRFSGDLAHELRTPITALRLETEVLLEKARSQEEYCTALENNLLELERLSELVERILLLARVDNLQLMGQCQPFLVRPAVEKLLAFYSYLAEEKQIELRLEGEIQVNGNQALIEQAVGNLLSNAIQYSLAGSTIQVSLIEQTDGDNETIGIIRVSDTGMGIAEEHLSHIFDRFYRGDPSRSQLVAGHGLGLAIVKSIMDAHGASIRVQSQPGQGSTFSLCFIKG